MIPQVFTPCNSHQTWFHPTLLWTILVFFPLAIYSSPDSTVFFSSKDHPYIRLISSKDYKGKALWGYMNGGADLYYECGFRSLRVEEFKFQGTRIKAEIFHMESFTSALAIYTHNRLNCPGKLENVLFSCCTPYQTQFVKGSFYCSLTLSYVTEASVNAIKEMVSILYAKLPDESLQDQLPDPFSNASIFPDISGLSVIAGPLGSQELFSDWTETLSEFPGLVAFHLPVIIQDIAADLFLLRFREEAHCQKFLQKEEATRLIIRELPGKQIVTDQIAYACEMLVIKGSVDAESGGTYIRQLLPSRK
ncbi:MAG: hypothetical protein FJY10_01245 [Bacteroidetes bacterium]|nr:hypothetical protein [Bacteroidota bacterium]